VHLWRALIALDSKAGDVPVLEELRAAHVLFLRSRLVAWRTHAGDPSTLDSLFQRDLSPHTLILFNEKLAPARRGPALDRAVRLAAAFGRVAPLELMGLEGDAPPRRELGDVFFDPERLAILKAMRTATREDYERRREELRDSPRFAGDPDARNNQAQILGHLVRQLVEAENDEREALTERVKGSLKERDPATIPTGELRLIYANLLELLTPSMHAYGLAGQLRGENRTTEARELCQQALATLRTAPLGSSYWSELSSARFELLSGSTLMDDGRASDAETIYLAAERRLDAIESQMEERRSNAADPEMALQLQAQTQAIRELRGDALLSLAVNANVRMGKPARALEYFERAYELNQSPFMRVLRACYRARSGKADEARTVLRSVTPVPSLYYNIACTHALLGEKSEALEFLERDLAENHPSAGSLAQKREWARKDPDLASLRGEPRFERLFGEQGN
jgi:tetratricopeptide (TPR) repeat protein